MPDSAWQIVAAIARTPTLALLAIVGYPMSRTELGLARFRHISKAG